MGTVVFPNAQVKLFLDASAEERAKDAINSCKIRGINGNFAQILAEIQERDFRDRNREVAPLKPADDALLLDSTTLSIDEVIAQALAYIQQKRQFRFNCLFRKNRHLSSTPHFMDLNVDVINLN